MQRRQPTWRRPSSSRLNGSEEATARSGKLMGGQCARVCSHRAAGTPHLTDDSLEPLEVDDRSTDPWGRDHTQEGSSAGEGSNAFALSPPPMDSQCQGG